MREPGKTANGNKTESEVDKHKTNNSPGPYVPSVPKYVTLNPT